jgi:hypothetical protein
VHEVAYRLASNRDCLDAGTVRGGRQAACSGGRPRRYWWHIYICWKQSRCMWSAARSQQLGQGTHGSIPAERSTGPSATVQRSSRKCHRMGECIMSHTQQHMWHSSCWGMLHPRRLNPSHLCPTRFLPATNTATAAPASACPAIAAQDSKPGTAPWRRRCGVRIVGLKKLTISSRYREPTIAFVHTMSRVQRVERAHTWLRSQACRAFSAFRCKAAHSRRRPIFSLASCNACGVSRSGLEILLSTLVRCAAS